MKNSSLKIKIKLMFTMRQVLSFALFSSLVTCGIVVSAENAAKQMDPAAVSELTTAQDVKSDLALARLDALDLWSRQNFEERKTREFSELLNTILGAGKAAVFVRYQWPSAGQRSESLRPVNVSATVLLDPTISEAQSTFVRDLAARVLEFDPARSDKVEVFRVASKSRVREMLFSPESVMDLIKFSATVLLVLIGFAVLLRVSRQISESLDRVATTTRTHDIDLTLAPKMQAGIEAAQSRTRMAALSAAPEVSAVAPSLAAPLSADPEVLSRILEEEDPRSIALFISTLDSEVAGRSLARLSSAKQEEVAMMLSGMDSPGEPRELAQVQARVHLKVRKTLLEKK